MNLNLGCGALYLEGFINIDGYDDCVADLICDLMRLPFKSASVERIVCHHVIEHLGYIRAIYTLAECHRVLKPGGRLILETPDIEASFKAFLEGKSVAHRSALLTWIFGHDTPGHLHRILFPKKLLKQLLHHSGFDSVRFQKQQTHIYREGIRVEVRAVKAVLFDIFSQCRQKLIGEKRIDIDNHFLCLDFEKTFFENIRKCHMDGYKDIDPILTNIICAPDAAIIWLEAIQKMGGLPGKDLKKLIAVNHRLCEISLPSRLFGKFYTLIDDPEHDGDVHAFIVLQALNGIKASMNRAPADIAQRVQAMFPDKAPQAYTSFSLYYLAFEARRLRDRGIKQMLLQNYHSAANHLRRAVNSGIDTLYAIINYAILHQVAGQYHEAVRLNRSALSHKTDHRIYDMILEETVKCLLHIGQTDEALLEAKRFRHRQTRRFWVSTVQYHKGNRSRSMRQFRQLKTEKFNHPFLKYYLKASGNKNAPRISPPPVRTKPLLAGEGLFHDAMV